MASIAPQKETYDQAAKRLLKDPGLPLPNPTEAYWQSPPHELSNVQSAELPETVDVVIIGSGITGCSVAYHLLTQSPSQNSPPDTKGKIVVLEARTLCSGATGRNGGHIATNPVLDYPSLKKKFGKDEAAKICKFRVSHLEEILGVVKTLKENGVEDLMEKSEIRKVEGVVGFLDEEGVEGVKEAMEELGREWQEGVEGVRFVGGEGVREEFNMPGVRALIVEQAGALWPYRLITSIFSYLLKTYPENLSIETSTPALSITTSSNPKYRYEIQTPRGKILTERIVHATNAHASHLLPGLKGKLFPVRGMMTVQAPTEGFGNLGGKRSWSVAWGWTGLDYIQQNERTGEVFYGGGLVEGNNGGLGELGNVDDGEIESGALNHLKGGLKKYFRDGNGGEGGEGKVVSKWSGIMGFTGDEVPLVGRVGRGVTGREDGGREGEVDGEWVCAGFNGYGMVHCWGCGRGVVDLMEGRGVNEWFPGAFLVSEERVDGLNAREGIESLLGPES